MLDCGLDCTQAAEANRDVASYYIHTDTVVSMCYKDVGVMPVAWRLAHLYGAAGYSINPLAERCWILRPTSSTITGDRRITILQKHRRVQYWMVMA